MIGTDFTRYDCQVGRQRRTYETLQREWRCLTCGGRLGQKWSEGDDRYPANWHIECLSCGGTDFVHEYELHRQQREAVEVLAGLPAQIRDLFSPGELAPKRRPLSLDEANRVLHGVLVDI
ncbi:MAG: hypothetical protein DRJ03_25780 [Chloroflexi bacterium]|nr:MAG: hypothetical protein DRJ03_25780 [Chloroflexota bacterium]